jgi:MFS-type transporter involved in bile tolerance (Atg22 family)
VSVHINTLGEIFLVFLSGVTVMGVFAALHWKLFAAPLINKVMAPIVDNIDIHGRILRQKFPEEYDQFKEDVRGDRELRGMA